MAYEPTEWKSGDVVTSAKLNKLEQAVAGLAGVLVVTGTDEALDKTWQEIYDADFAIIKVSIGSGVVKLIHVDQIGSTGEDYYFIITNTTDKFSTTSANGYPVFEE